MNPIKKAYEAFDNTIMYGVNKGVKAWNYTTGRTKSDLANLLLLPGILFGIINDDIAYQTLGLIFAPIAKYSNDWVDKCDQNSSEAKSIDQEAELFKRAYSISGPMLLVSSFMNGVSAVSSDSNSDFMRKTNYFLNTLLIGSSFYVMRAESLPPRKSAFSRARDYLSEKLLESSQKPASVPVQANKTNNYQKLEDYLR